MECLCMVPLTPAVMVISGLVYHPLVCIVLMRGLYLVCLCVRAWSRYLSWQYVNSMSWVVSVGEGIIGVYVWFGAPIMHRIFGRSLAWHLHILCGHVHLMSQFGIACSGGLLLRLPALVSVKNPVFMLACNDWVMRCIALLCHVILKPFRYGCSHVDSKWGHVSLSLWWHNVQLGFGCLRDQNIFYLGLAMYCAYQNFSVWMMPHTFPCHCTTFIVFPYFGHFPLQVTSKILRLSANSPNKSLCLLDTDSLKLY